MAMNCDPCQCPEQHYREKQTWRKAVITLICTLIARINTLAAAITEMAGGMGDPDPLPLFAWDTTEQVWPYERNSNAEILYAKEVQGLVSPGAGFVNIAHGVTLSSVSKIFRLEGMMVADDGSRVWGLSAGDMSLQATTTHVGIYDFVGYTGYTGVIRMIYSKD